MRNSNKTWIVVVLVAFICMTSPKSECLAQTKYVYCEVIGVEKLLTTRVNIVVDFGERMKFFANNRMKDEKTGKPMVFNTMMDALNFMGKQGWEFSQAYTTTVQNVSTYHFLMKKPFELLEEEEKAEFNKN